jgi:sodium-dependent dicarboxylate transporter 2/3/5
VTERVGFWAGLALFVGMLLLPAPAGMPTTAWQASAIVLLMAVWWMTQALPLTATALVPFLAFPLLGIMSANETAAAYYSPILFLVLGGAMIALAIERTGLHRRLALAIVKRGGATPGAMLLAFMIATACLSFIVSNTATTLIMIPIAVAVLKAAQVPEGETSGFAGALVMGVAFAASIGGLGTWSDRRPTRSPPDRRALDRAQDRFPDLGALRLAGRPDLDPALLAHSAQGPAGPPRRLRRGRRPRRHRRGGRVEHRRETPGAAGRGRRARLDLVPLLSSYLPADALTDGSIAILGALLLFVIPDGTGRAILNWDEANRAPWGVIMMFGGGLALAAGIGESGLAKWLGVALQPLSNVPPLVVALVLVGLVILITEFASNVATASGIIPVVGGLIAATGVDPILLALPRRLCRELGLHAPLRHRPQCHCLGDRAHRAAAHAEGGAVARSGRRPDHGRHGVGDRGADPVTRYAIRAHSIRLLLLRNISARGAGWDKSNNSLRLTPGRRII